MTENSTFYSLSQAAEATGKSKSVISKALKNGTLSYTKKDEKGYKIDPSELHRVFPKKNENSKKNTEKERSRTLENDIENRIRIKELEAQLQASSTEKSLYKNQLEKLEQDRDDWKKQAQTLLLQHTPKESPQKPVEPPKGFLARLVGA